MSEATLYPEAGPDDVRPVVRTAAASNLGVWLFGAFVVIVGLSLFLAMNSRRQDLANSSTFPTGQGGGMIAAFATARSGASAVFLVNALSFVFVIAALYLWKRKPVRTSQLPAERFLGSLRAGVRYVRHSPELHSVLIRTFLSFALEVELTGRWPWQSADEPPG